MAGLRRAGAVLPASPFPAASRDIPMRSLCYAPRQRVRPWSLP
ncbi:hypothetical protein HEP74_03966 [Xanthomonas sp. SS]|nr:hypothetical protein HEP74_03966 [Xanthomonas sp. SS]